MTKSALVSILRSRDTLTVIALAGLLAMVSGSHPHAQPDPDRLAMVKAMTFDVFGTVVDWRSSIVREGEELTTRKGIEVDWPRFADAWRAGYGPAMRRVRASELPWTKIDDLHRMILEGLIPDFGLTALSEAERDDLNRVWHRLLPWPDTVSGLTRLRTRYVLASLSNGNVALLVNMAKAQRVAMGRCALGRARAPVQAGPGGVSHRRRPAGVTT